MFDVRPYAERELLGGADVAPVAREELQRVERRLGRVRIACRHDAAAHVAGRRDDCVTDTHAAPYPLVLFVRTRARHPDEHPKTPRIHRPGRCTLRLESCR